VYLLYEERKKSSGNGTGPFTALTKNPLFPEETQAVVAVSLKSSDGVNVAVLLSHPHRKRLIVSVSLCSEVGDVIATGREACDSDDLGHGWCAHIHTPEGSVHAANTCALLLYILHYI